MGCLIGLACNHHECCIDDQRRRVAPECGGTGTKIGNGRGGHLTGAAGNEDTLRVGSGELTTARRPPGLKQNRRSLWRGFTEVIGVHLEIFPFVPHLVDLIRPGKDPFAFVTQHSVVLPASFPKLVDHFHEFFRQCVTLVVRELRTAAKSPGRAIEVAGDDVPGNPAVSQMIQSGKPAREAEGRLIGDRAGDAEAKVLRHHRHGGHQQERIVDGELDGVAERGIGVAAIHVINAKDIGDKERVEHAAFQQLGQFGPVGESVVAVGPIVGMEPQSRRSTAAIHVERVQAYLLLCAHT